MSLRNKLGAGPSGRAEIDTSITQQRSDYGQSYGELKASIHRMILERVDLQMMEGLTQQQTKDGLKNLVEELLVVENVVINEIERRQLVRDIQHEMFGLGPLEPLMADPSVTDILVNTCMQVFVERGGKLELTSVRFNDDAHLMKIIDKIVSGVGRRIDESSPMVDARLPDGSRVNVIIPPLAVDGPIMSIRRFSAKPLTMTDFIQKRSLTPAMAELLEGAVKAELNMIISGGTGSGKTSLLNILSSYIGSTERIVTIEDTAELRLQQPHVVRLESRTANIEGKGEISQRDLVRNALRMRPDRIVLGEVRGAEAVDMLQAMNTGHDGSLATIHANTPRDAVSRLETMIAQAGLNLPLKAARHQISSALSIVIQASRMTDGKRRITSILEISGMEGEAITMQEIFTFRQTGVSSNGDIEGHFCATGLRPVFTDRLRAQGIEFAESLFDPNRLFDAKSGAVLT
jgi:pilus assembly protein CpaF